MIVAGATFGALNRHICWAIDLAFDFLGSAHLGEYRLVSALLVFCAWIIIH